MRVALIAVSLSAGLLAGCAAPTPSLGSEGSPDSEVSVLSLQVGSCLNDVDQPIAQEMTEIPAVDCEEPHQSEVYAEVFIDDASFPGIDTVTAFAIERCEAEFEQFVGLPYAESTLSFHYYYPTQNSWAIGDRSVFCVVYDPAGNSEGSLANTRR